MNIHELGRRLHGRAVACAALLAVVVALVVSVVAGVWSAPAAVDPSSSVSSAVSTSSALGAPAHHASRAGHHVTPAYAPTPLPSRSGQISALAGVLKKMEAHYASYVDDVPGPSDIVDYGIGPLWLKGIDGAGTTVAVLEGWNLPGIGQDVASFDKIWGLPNPVIETIYPSGDGKLPAKCPAGMQALGDYGSCQGWGGELELDVLSAHLIAPYAKILIVVTPADSQITDDAASQVAPYEMMESLEAIAAGHLANVVSVSTGTAESSYSYGSAEIDAQDPGEPAAAAAGIPVCIATGDRGVVQTLPSHNGTVLTKVPDTAAWDDSPWITAVGGTVPNLSNSGKRLGPDPLWKYQGYGEGAGFSSIFTRPSYQDDVAKLDGATMRSVPDITMDARHGTSEAAPLLAGVLALATQMNKADVGPVNPALYDVLGPKGAKDGIADVVSGNDSYTPPHGTKVPGFSAGKGFDVASGWGTVYAPLFVPALVAATKSSQQERSWRHSAAADLAALRHGARLTRTKVPAGGTTYLLAGDFLPHHPVQMVIDSKVVATLWASPLGKVTYMIDPALLGLAAGAHTVTLKSMLLEESVSFTSS